MSEPSAIKRPRRGARKTTRKTELTDDLASGSEALDSRDVPSFSVQEDILVYRTEPGEAVLLKEPDSDNEAQGTHRGATPSMSQRVANAAQTAKDTVQDTLTSAIDQGREHLPFNWPALLGLLLLTLLAGHGLSTLLRPHYKSDDISFFNRSIDQANHRYKQLGDYVAKTEGKLKDTEHRLKDAVKQVLHLQSSHTDSASHHSVLQDQMHKLSDKVSQATHFLGVGGRSKGGWLSKGSDSEEEEEEHTDSSGLPSAVENPIKFLIHQQLEIFAADKTGLPDYANFHAGGRVIGHSQVYKSANPPFTHLTYWGCYLWPGCSPVVPDAAEKLLTPAMSPGQCFPLNGSTGYVDIQLHTPIAITGFSLEHIPSAIAYDITSAPNKVALEVLSAPETHKVKGGLFTPHKTHGPFRYNLKANSAVQTFSIFSESPEPASFVRLKVHSNHGHNMFTCLYRIRIHGEPV